MFTKTNEKLGLIHHFAYRGGEITARVFADTSEEARKKLDKVLWTGVNQADVQFESHPANTHPDFWEGEDG
jgi:hypothetical protein